MVNYKVKETYRNTGLKCFKIGFQYFLENLGDRFEDRGLERHGRGLVSWGYYDEEIILRIFHTGKILHGVHVQYEGSSPASDLKELRSYFEEMELKNKKTITRILEGRPETIVRGFAV